MTSADPLLDTLGIVRSVIEAGPDSPAAIDVICRMDRRELLDAYAQSIGLLARLYAHTADATGRNASDVIAKHMDLIREANGGAA